METGFRSTIRLSDAAEDRLQLVFAPEERAEARRILVQECGAAVGTFGDDPSAYDRIRFAALKVSCGRLEGLRRAIAIARSDWRDLLVAAGFADDSTEHERWLVAGSTEAASATQRWEAMDSLARSALPQLPGIVIAPGQRHSSSLAFTVHGVPAHEFVHALLSSRDLRVLRRGDRPRRAPPRSRVGEVLHVRLLTRRDGDRFRRRNLFNLSIDY